MTSPRTFESVDYEAFARDVKALGEEASEHLGEDDLKHLRKIELWGRLCTVLGYATAWIFPNPPTTRPLMAVMSFERGWWNTFYSVRVKPTCDVIAHIE